MSELKSYPWYVDDWFKSETRLMYTLEERGLYRELLDACWDKGSLPNDPEMLAQIVAANGKTHSPFIDLLHKILLQFTLDPDDDRWHHPKIDEKRNEILELKAMRREFAARGGRANAGKRRSSADKAKAKAKSCCPPSPSPSPSPPPSPCSSVLVCSFDKNPPLPTPAPFFRENNGGGGGGVRGLKITARTLRSYYPSCEDDFIEKLATLASDAAAMVDEQKLMLTDELLAHAVRQCREDNPDQRGAGLFLKTVPRLITIWIRDGREIPVPKIPPRKMTRTEQRDFEVIEKMKAARLAREATAK